MFADFFVRVAGENPVMQAVVGGLVIALANLVGASLVFVLREPSERTLDALLGFAAGVMLSAAFTSLIIPGVEVEPHGGIVPVIVGILLGVVVLDRADAWVPHVHVLITGRKRADQAVESARFGSVVLFIVAITLHNIPEGLAVGVGFGSGNLGDALALMLAIGIQNIPEGLAVSVAAVNAGFDRFSYAALTGIRSGLVELPVCILGAYAVTQAGFLLPYAMGFAAGAMLFVISDEIVPETHSRGHERVATLGTMVGVVVMLYLDVVLG
ncbi:ZIP family metal transporter [Halospeciosus flavus]|uniref:ZIP family metal transporter n=1 Tax=Halospeciosus flavus TaxID=3032283 RepID=A0ABD5Z9K8_9EURY|nr:ZIP family metal transporter [Halospeciosus flavus]